MEMVYMKAIQATEVRKNWGEFIDTVVHEKPKLLKRNRELFVALALPLLKALIEDFKLHVTFQAEDDGSITASCEEIDVVVNAENEQAAKMKLAADLVEYAEEYFEEFEMYYNTPNRKPHFRYVFNALLQNSLGGVSQMFLTFNQTITCPFG